MIRAVIFDVYKTLLRVEPPLPDVQSRWKALCYEFFRGRVSLCLADFNARCDEMIARAHMKAKGIAYPEVYWPDIASEALDAVAGLPAEARDEFLFRHAGLRHRVSLMPGAGEAVKRLQQAGMLLGIASNAQPYTLRELAEALGSGGISWSIFLPEIVFWSFEHGFSKPDPHVFRFLMARLQARGIAAAEILMVGDREDNDIEPAQTQGWQTWLLAENAAERAGDWSALLTFVGKKNPPNSSARLG